MEAFIKQAARAEQKAAPALLQKMVRQWPFFRTLLSNMDMVLAKSDLPWPPLRRTGARQAPAQEGVCCH